MNDADLLAYLDESLATADMARIEQALRVDQALGKRLTDLAQRRDAGVHSLGEIWRRHRLGCPGRSRLGSFLLGVLSAEEAQYIAVHLEIVGCRVCQANVDDLRSSATQPEPATASRRQRLFQSTIGRLGASR